jgi:hypothetical protein
MMSTIFFFIIGIFLGRLFIKGMAGLDAKYKAGIIRDVLKACPPHKWNYRKDKDGVERLFCDLCHNAPGYAGRI